MHHKPIFCLLLTLLLFSGSPLRGESLVLDFDFPAPVLHEQGSVHEVTVGSLPTSLEAGRPALPFRPTRILLPFGKRVASLQILPAPWQAHPEAVKLATVVPIGPISLQTGSRSRFLKLFPPAPVENAAEKGPEASHVSRGLQRLCGYAMVDLNLRPVRYDAAAQTLESTRHITVRVELEDEAPTLTGEASNLIGDEAHARRISGLVENGELLGSYAGKAALRETTVPYLIVTTEFLRDAPGPDNLQAFAAFLEGRGVATEIVTVEEIATSEEGEDLAARIRARIARNYRTKGSAFVLLASDAHADAIPARRLHAEFVWEGRTFSQDLPADVYYACLDGSFNEDGDAHYGEPNDGPDGGEVDLYAEVAVGRAPVDTFEELAAFVRKTRKAYAMADENVCRKILFAGENLFPGVWGSQYMGELETGADTHGFVTQGVPASWTVDHLFDKSASGVKTWRSGDLVKKFNGNPYQVHHVGHSATWMMMRMYSSALAGIHADEPFLVYTQGCHCGRFTDNDCIAEKLFNAPEGPFAVFSNSHYGLGPEDPDDDTTVVCRGASQYFHRQFVDGLFGEGIFRLGLLNEDSKEDNIPWMHHGTTRWVFWEMNLFGDPHLPLVH